MAGLSSVLEIGKNTLLNSQLQIQTASNNISNAENKSYARQKVGLGANPATLVRGDWVGGGASITGIAQVRDRFIEQRLMSAISDESNSKTLLSQLDLVQGTYIDDGENGISEALSTFWDSWDTLVQNPADLSGQTEVYQAADNLADKLNATYAQLNEVVSQELPGRVTDTIDRANLLIDQIASFNTEIMKNEYNGNTANTLRDQRYDAMTELSEIIPVTFAEDVSGSYTITTVDSGGTTLTLVDRGTATPLAYGTDIRGGALGGLLDSGDKINGYITMLDAFADTLSAAVNGAHGSAVFSGSGAAGITAGTSFIGAPATESGVALQVAALRDSLIAFPDGSNVRFSEYLGKIQSTIGLDAQTAQMQSDFNEALRTQLYSQQQSISGVSIDEEMVDMIQFQHVYQAAAKLIQTTSELLDTIINMV